MLSRAILGALGRLLDGSERMRAIGLPGYLHPLTFLTHTLVTVGSGVSHFTIPNLLISFSPLSSVGNPSLGQTGVEETKVKTLVLWLNA
jgi:hypothetical protein